MTYSVEDPREMHDDEPERSHKTLSASYGEADAPFSVEVFENDGTYIERLGFETRRSLAIFFEDGATMAPDRYYRVKHQPRV